MNKYQNLLKIKTFSDIYTKNKKLQTQPVHNPDKGRFLKNI